MVVIFDDDEVFLGNHEIFAVDLVKNLRLQDLRGWGGGEESGFEENQSIHARADHIDVVRNQEDGQLQFIMKMLHELDNVVLGRNIQACSRFIQYQDLGLLSQGPGDKDALLLAAGQLPESMICVRFHPDLSQGLHGDVTILPSWTLEQTQRSVTTHHHCFKDRHREIPIDDPFLREVADFSAMVTAELVTSTVEDMKMSLHWSEKPQHGTTQRRLARSIWTDDTDEFTVVNSQRDVFERNEPGKPERGMVKTDDRLAGIRHGIRSSFRRHREQLRGGFQCSGQLEHIIAKHVEVGRGSSQTARHRRQDHDVGLGFPRQELRESLAELNLGYDHLDLLPSNFLDERL